jgi:hypothetical protein
VFFFTKTYLKDKGLHEEVWLPRHSIGNVVSHHVSKLESKTSKDFIGVYVRSDKGPHHLMYSWDTNCAWKVWSHLVWTCFCQSGPYTSGYGLIGFSTFFSVSSYRLCENKATNDFGLGCCHLWWQPVGHEFWQDKLHTTLARFIFILPLQ